MFIILVIAALIFVATFVLIAVSVISTVDRYKLIQINANGILTENELLPHIIVHLHPSPRPLGQEFSASIPAQA